MKISDIKKDPHTLPKEIEGIDLTENIYFTPVTTSCVITGLNVAQVNALRRTAIDELPVKAFQLDMLNTTDLYVIREVIEDRVAEIPILQDYDYEGSTFKLDNTGVNDDRFRVLNIKTNHIIESKNNKDLGAITKRLCNNFTILQLAARNNAYMTFKVVTKEGFEMGQHSLVSRFIFRQTGDKQHDSLSEYLKPRQFYIEYDTKGNIEPENVLELSRQSIIKRLEAIVPILPNIVYIERDLLTIKVPNETDTIGNMLYTDLVENEEDSLKFCAYCIGHDIRCFDLQMKLKRESTDPKKDAVDITKRAIKRIIDAFSRD